MGEDPAEGHRRAEGDAAAGVVAAHHAGHVVAGSVQTGDRRAVGAQHLGVGIDRQPGEGAQTAGHDLHRVERPLLDRRDAGVGAGVLRVALHAVVGDAAAVEGGVAALAGVQVVVVDRAQQACGVDAAGAGQLGERGAPLQVAAPQVRAAGQREGPHRAQPPAAQEAVVHHQPGFDRLAREVLRAAGEQGAHEGVVVAGFVDEAPPRAVHRDQARLAALGQVGEIGEGAQSIRRARRVRYHRHRAPGARICQVGGDAGAGRLGQAQAVAGVAGHGGGAVLVAVGRVREEGGLARIIVRKAAAGTDHTAARAQRHLALRRAQPGADDAAAAPFSFLDQADGRVPLAQRHACVQHRLQQRGRQRIAAQTQPPLAVQRELQQVAAGALCGVEEGIPGAAGAQEMAQVAADAHAQEAQQRRGGAQALQVGAEPPAVEGCGTDRAPARARGLGAAVKVGDRVAVDEAQRGVVKVELQHLRRAGQEGLGALRVQVAADDALQVAARFVDRLGDACGQRQRVARDPHPAAGPGGGAAEDRLLLGHDHLQPQVGSGDRSAQRPGAGAEHQQVAVEGVRGSGRGRGGAIQVGLLQGE